MQRYRLLTVLGFLSAFNLAYANSPALAATPGFTIAATSVTLSSSGSSGFGSSSLTLTSVNGYTGTVQVVCSPPAPPTGVKVPYCGNGPVAIPPYTLTANQAVKGSVSFFNSPVPDAVASLPRRGSPGPAPGLALAGMLLLGIAGRRRAARFLTLMVFAAGTLAGLVGISACGGSNNVVTPGTYAYTIMATDIHTTESVTASVNVTVP